MKAYGFNPNARVRSKPYNTPFAVTIMYHYLQLTYDARESGKRVFGLFLYMGGIPLMPRC